MKAFTYIDENNEEQIDLIHLFEHAFDYKVSSQDVVIALSIINKYAQIDQNK